MERTSFYTLEEVEKEMRSSLDNEYVSPNTDFEYLSRLDERNLKAKAGLNKVLFGNENKRFDVISLLPSRSRLESAFRYSLSTIQRLCIKFDIDEKVTFDVIKENKMPDGAKFSRLLLRKMGDNKKKPIYDITSSPLYDARKELGNLPEDDNAITPEIFIQNFYSALSAFRANIVISTAFADMLTATEFASFTSCYRFSGAYASSTFVRGLDKQTAIVFLVNSNSKTKTGRFWVTFNHDAMRFITFPTYGEMSSCNYNRVVSAIQERIATAKGIANTWEDDEYADDLFKIASTPAYIDDATKMYSHTSEQAFGFDLYWPWPVCPSCGAQHDEQSILCSDCRDNRERCEKCGCQLSEDEAYFDEHTDCTYCESCYDDLFVTCRGCGERLRVDHDTILQGSDGHDYCETCYYDTFADCDECGDTCEINAMSYIEGEDIHVCPDCLDKYFTECTSCGEHFRNDEMAVAFGNEAYCHECFDDILDNGDKDNTWHDFMLHVMFEKDVFHALDEMTFPAATPYVHCPRTGDYVLFKADKFEEIETISISLYRTLQRAHICETPCRVRHSYHDISLFDYDFDIEGIDLRFISAKKYADYITILTPEQYGQFMTEKAMREFMARDVINNAGVPFLISPDELRVGDKVVFKPFYQWARYDNLSDGNDPYVSATMQEIAEQYGTVIVADTFAQGTETLFRGRSLERGTYIYHTDWIKRIIRDAA